jgi:hypothetical protein
VNALNIVRTEIQKIEDEYKKLNAQAEAGGVKAIRAKNEIAQLDSREQMPLNRALITGV